MLKAAKWPVITGLQGIYVFPKLLPAKFASVSTSGVNVCYGLPYISV